jgi:hypothetical protein
MVLVRRSAWRTSIAIGNGLAFDRLQTVGQVVLHGSLLMNPRRHHKHRASVHDHWRGGHELLDQVITTSGLGDHERVEYASVTLG